jgi:uncharacterized protein YbjT (DUF2867 family)
MSLGPVWGGCQMKTVLVTGVRGKTGRQVAAALLRRKRVTVRGAARDVEELKVPGVTLSRFDWQEPASWPAALADVEAMYLLRPKTADPAGTIASLLGSTRSLQRVVFLSEIDAGNRPENTEERKAEAVIKSCAIDWTILRPNWFMQNFTEPFFYLEPIRDAGELEVPTGGQATSFVDTRDIADVATTALLDGGHSSQCYTLTGPQELTWAEVCRLIGQIAGHSVRYIDPPLEDHLAALSKKGTAISTLNYLGRIYGCIQDGRTSMISGDIERVVGHPARGFAGFVEQNKKVWRRARQ